MEIRIRSDAVEIEGYVNSIERKSKKLWSRLGQFVERVCKGAFSKAIKRNDNVRILLNHDPNRDLGGTKDGNLELEEDAIGLGAKATITDPEVIQLARHGDLVGWSFGFYDRDVEVKTDEDGYPLRDIHDLDLEEVSILDRSKTPAYDGTLISVRADDNALMFGETFTDEVQIREEAAKAATEEVQNQPVADKEIDFSEWHEFLTWAKTQGGKKDV
jgi:HK97 family phage prohead protease